MVLFENWIIKTLHKPSYAADNQYNEDHRKHNNNHRRYDYHIWKI